MTLAIFFQLFMIACAIIIIALMDNPWIRLIWACLIVGGTLPWLYIRIKDYRKRNKGVSV